MFEWLKHGNDRITLQDGDEFIEDQHDCVGDQTDPYQLAKTLVGREPKVEDEERGLDQPMNDIVEDLLDEQKLAVGISTYSFHCMAALRLTSNNLPPGSM